MNKTIETNTKVRAIGDVHGGFEMFEHYVKEAVEKDMHVLQLGDLEDRGPEPAKCIKLMMDLADEGKATVVMSNHGWKHYRYFLGRAVSEREEHKKTRINIRSMGDDFVMRYMNFMEDVPWYVTYGNNFFAHASYHKLVHIDDRTNKQTKGLRERLIYGMTTGKKGENGLPERLLDWFDHIPEDMNVFVGHHILSMDRILRFQTTGGTATFVDLGHQTREDGQLAYVDFDNGEVSASSHDFEMVNDPRGYGMYHVEE